MIYAIQSGDRTIALTNCKNNALRLSTENPDFKTRWATPSEAAFFRNRESAVQRRWWPVLKYRSKRRFGGCSIHLSQRCTSIANKEIILPKRPPQFRPATYRPPAAKVADPYYASTPWRELRAKRLAMDNHTCVVEGYGQRAIVADHIVSRSAGGADSITNLRSLCRLHDNQARERSDGTRKNELGNELYHISLIRTYEPTGAIRWT
jgi:HNH endonuclease